MDQHLDHLDIYLGFACCAVIVLFLLAGMIA